MNDAVLPAEQDQSRDHGRRGHDVGHLFIDPPGGETPIRPPRSEIEADELVSERDGIQAVSVADEVGHHAGAGSILPPDDPRLLLEGIDVSNTSRVAVIAAEDNQVRGDNWDSVKLSLLSTVLESVVLPPGLPCPPVDAMDHAIAGTDEHKVPRDRGEREDSAARLVLPQDLASGAGCRRRLLRRHEPRPDRNSEPKSAWQNSVRESLHAAPSLRVVPLRFLF